MKKPLAWPSLKSRNHILIGTLVIGAIVATTFFCFSEGAVDKYFRSVELGLAELSPLGEEGGYAIPASGEAEPACTLTFADDTIEQGQTTNLTVKWNGGGWFLTKSYQIGRCDLQVYGSPSTCNSTWWTTPPWARLYENNGYNSKNNHLAGGTTKSFTFNALASGLSPGRYYYRINMSFSGTAAHPRSDTDKACAATLTVANGGGDTGLDLTLEVAKVGTNTWRNAVTVTPTEEAKIRWTTTNAETCTVEAPARNLQVSVANGLWREDSDVDEPPIDSTYAYTVRCTREVAGGGGDTVSANLYNLRSNEASGSARKKVADDIISGGGFISGIGSPYNDSATRAHICVLIGGSGATVSTYTTGSYYSPNNNLIYRRGGSSWTSSRASSYNSFVRNITCLTAGGGSGEESVSRTVHVTRIADDVPIVGVIRPCNSNYVVRRGQEFCMEYETSAPTQCVIRLGQNTIINSPLLATDQFHWSLNSQGTFVLYCDGVGIDDATIKVLPEFQET